MHWLSSAAAVQLLCLLDIAAAISDYGFGTSKKLTGRQEALLVFKRQTSCQDGYFLCPVEFGGGCCANGRRCATRDCPVMQPGSPDPNAVTGAPTSVAQPTTQPPTSAPPQTTAQPDTTSQEPPSSTNPAETTAQTTAPSSTEATDTASQSGTATNAADGASSSTAAASADGTQYTPMGISSGAIVGIVFAAITGVVIVGLVLWRAIIGIRNPKKKGKKRAAPGPPQLGGGGGNGGGAVGAAGAGSRGLFGGNRRLFGALSNPFAKKPTGPTAQPMMMAHGHSDEQPMSQTAAAMGFGPQSGGNQGVPPYMQDRSSLEEQDTSYNNGRGFQGGDLGSYRSVESFDRDDANQGLFRTS
ncbi:hypothetical protein H072_3128 [Dactylellina haptotyla CBS 200.50]|uniref:Mid2 domain-containing protein n=1 Tax=Dactylellina haptotyla (strain CBS 200.50) TaxID=1284197 RepID=S8AIS3_DACHA|nr:hypothetical protein H072_3128 [Dactylellina haptotyla CBS 200.50]